MCRGICKNCILQSERAHKWIMIPCPCTCKVLFLWLDYFNAGLKETDFADWRTTGWVKLGLALCRACIWSKRKKNFETSNRKVRIHESWKMCGCKVNSVLYRRKRTSWSQTERPPFIFAHVLTSGHEYMCFHHLWVCAHTCALQTLCVCYMTTVYKHSLSPVTGHQSYSGLLFRCTPS